MVKQTSRLSAALVIAAMTCVSGIRAVGAQQIWFNPFTDPDPYYSEPYEEPQSNSPQSRPRYKTTQPAKPMSVIEASTPMVNTLKDFPQMKILGLWVGNVRYRVGNADGRLYLISQDGQLKLLPTKTNADSITIPEDSPVISRLLKEQPAAGDDNQVSANGTKLKIGQVGLLRPKVIGTRTQMVKGKAVVSAGAIISEWDWSTKSSENKPTDR